MIKNIRYVFFLCFLLCGSILTATWMPLPPEEVAAGFGVTPQIAIDPAGNAMAIWVDGQVGSTRVSYKPVNSSWSPYEQLTPTGDAATSPHVVMDQNGNTMAIWIANDSGKQVVKYSYKPIGGSWDAVATNLSDSSQHAKSPQIAVDAEGNVIVVWARFNGTNWIIQARYKLFGSAWTENAVNLSEIDQDAELPQIAMDPGGDAVAVWVRSNGTNTIIQSKNRPFNGNWDSAAANLSKAGQNAYVPCVAMDASGNAVAIWSRHDGSNLIIQAKSQPFNGNWDTVATNLSQAGQDAFYQQIAMDPQGNVVVVWLKWNGLRYAVQAKQRFPNGNWVKGAINLSQTSLDGTFPQIAMDANGNAMAVWAASDDSKTIEQARYKAASGYWEKTAVDLSEGGTSNYYIVIAMNPRGNAIALWSQVMPDQVIKSREYIKDK